MKKEKKTTKDAMLVITTGMEDWGADGRWEALQSLVTEIDTFSEELRGADAKSCAALLVTRPGVVIHVICKDPKTALETLLPTLKMYQFNVTNDDDESPFDLFVELPGEDPISIYENYEPDEWLCDDCKQAQEEEAMAEAEPEPKKLH